VFLIVLYGRELGNHTKKLFMVFPVEEDGF